MKQTVDPHEAGLGPLFAPRVERLVGAGDPATSYAAASGMLEKLGAHQRAALDLIRRHPGKTCPELARLADLPAARARIGDEGIRQRIGRRLNELEKAGLVRAEGEREGCRIWWPMEPRP